MHTGWKDLIRFVGAIAIIAFLVSGMAFQRLEALRYRKDGERQAAAAKQLLVRTAELAQERDDLQKRVLDLGGMQIRLDVANKLITELEDRNARLNEAVLQSHGATLELTKKLYNAENKLRGLPQPAAEKPAGDCNP